MELIERLYLKEHLSFSEVELNFKRGLIVFTGASGAGKSVLMDGLLSTFGLKESQAKISEVSLNINFNFEEFEVEKDEPIVFKNIRKDKVRFFINNQTTSRNRVKTISLNFIKFLNLRDLSDFENESILNLIDLSIKDESYKKLQEEFKKEFEKFQILKRDLNKILSNYKELIELKDFLEYEIAKIEEINPKIDEYEELLENKKTLSKREKIEENLAKARGIFEFERVVDEVLSLAEIDSNFFDDAMNELRNQFEFIHDKLNELDTINIEKLLNRLEELSNLKRKYGSIEEAINYKNEKIEELKKYENLEENRQGLEIKVEKLEIELNLKAKKIKEIRLKHLPLIEERLNYYLQILHLKGVKLALKETTLSKFGIDKAEISLNSVEISHISLGEFNRLRLSLLATKVEFSQNEGGILILDEIDANLSGKESQSIGKVLSLLSNSYQIFSISHQPQLTSTAHQHFLVEKIDNQSFVREVLEKDRVSEIARMISGDKITKEALEFATKMIAENK